MSIGEKEMKGDKVQSIKKILNHWRSGNVKSALKFYRKCKAKGLFTEHDIERLDKIFPDPVDHLIEVFKNPSPKIVFHLLNEIQKKKNWTDENISNKFKIKMEDIKRIKEMKSTSKDVYYKLFTEGFMEELSISFITEKYGRENGKSN